ncbi:MAG: type II toxin-antitoxin system YoeB family toxin [Terracoccus sp.]
MHVLDPSSGYASRESPPGGSNRGRAWTQARASEGLPLGVGFAESRPAGPVHCPRTRRTTPAEATGTSSRPDLRAYWSRRVTDEHRLVHTIASDAVRIAACRYRYRWLPAARHIRSTPCVHPGRGYGEGL